MATDLAIDFCQHADCGRLPDGKYHRMKTNRIKQAREGAQIAQNELSRRSGISVSVLSRFESNERQPKLDHLVRIAQALELPLSELVEEGHPALQVIPGAAPVTNDAKIKVLGRVAAGTWLEIDHGIEFEQPIFVLHVPAVSSSPDKMSYGLLVVGTSINRVAVEGDVLICIDLGLSGVEIRDGDLVIVERRKRQEGLKEVTAKRVRRYSSRIELWPESDDPRWQEPIVIDHSHEDGETDVRVIARVEWVFRPVRRS